MLAGDMAIVVGPDGPSLGGFAAIAQIVRADLWRLGQVRAGDAVTLDPVDPGYATALQVNAEAEIASCGAHLRPRSVPLPARRQPPAPILDAPRDGSGGPMMFRRAGERCLLVEFGEPLLDLRSRVRVHLLRAALEQARARRACSTSRPACARCTSSTIPTACRRQTLLNLLVALEAQLPAPDAQPVAGRVVHLPLAWRDPLAMSAIARYESVRASAPWCPDNIEFIRRINGLPDEDAVRDIVFGASYLVLGLGDVYMGAPVAVPLDPRHRLVTTKYNPARTWTPPNAVGIGGAFLCVYGMEGPGGYQLVGRTVPIWHDGRRAAVAPAPLRSSCASSPSRPRSLRSCAPRARRERGRRASSRAASRSPRTSASCRTTPPRSRRSAPCARPRSASSARPGRGLPPPPDGSGAQLPRRHPDTLLAAATAPGVASAPAPAPPDDPRHEQRSRAATGRVAAADGRQYPVMRAARTCVRSGARWINRPSVRIGKTH